MTYGRLDKDGHLTYVGTRKVIIDGEIVLNPTDEQLSSVGIYPIEQVADDGYDYIYDGKIIHYIGKPLEEHEESITIDIAKERKVRELTDFDKSSAVNEFYYNGEPMWFPLDKRQGANGAIQARETLGQSEMTYTLDNGMQLTLPLQTWKQLLAIVECYAQDCYNVTASHADNIKRLETIEEVMEYDYTTGYPDKIHI